jgi:hypothetical protein
MAQKQQRSETKTTRIAGSSERVGKPAKQTDAKHPRAEGTGANSTTTAARPTR